MAIERITPLTKEWELFYANHIVRYKFASRELKEASAKKILDIACGVGYGTKYLSLIQDSAIIGVDRSAEALEVAKKEFNNENIEFIKDDCIRWDNIKSLDEFDAIVSFETLEHLASAEIFLSLCKSHLKQNGLLLISTPNSFVTSPDGIVLWEYHEKEYTPKEFYQLLRNAGFEKVRIFGQQFTTIGKLRQNFTAYANQINSNPFIRLGRLLQKVLRGSRFINHLVEQEEDFEIVEYEDYDSVEALGRTGPIVLIIVAMK